MATWPILVLGNTYIDQLVSQRKSFRAMWSVFHFLPSNDQILFLQDPRELNPQAELLECKDGSTNERTWSWPHWLVGEDQQHYTKDKQYRKHSEEVNTGYWGWQENSRMPHSFKAQNIVGASVKPQGKKQRPRAGSQHPRLTSELYESLPLNDFSHTLFI